MTRILFWLALVFLVMFAIRSKLKGAAPRRQPAPQPAPPQAQARRRQGSGDVETMLCCAHCGVFFPASEAVRAEGHDFCSAEHARLPAA